MLHGTGMKYYLPIHECHKFKPNVGNLFIHGAYGYCMDIYYNIYIYIHMYNISVGYQQVWTSPILLMLLMVSNMNQ